MRPHVAWPVGSCCCAGSYKLSVGLRATYYATDLMQVCGFHHFYNDSFGVRINAFELETPVKVTPFFVLYPFYHYHVQTAATCFASYLEHSITDVYVTSD